MLLVPYKTKKELKENKGKVFAYRETSIFGGEFKKNMTMLCTNEKRSYFAEVIVDNDGLIVRVK